MPLINMISERREQQARVSRTRKRLLAVLLTEISVLAGVFSFLGVGTMSLQTRLQRAHEEIQRLQPTLDQIAQIERETQALMPKLRTLTDAQQHTQRWFATINGIARSLPADVWLTGITSAQVQDSEKKSQSTLITLTGSTLTQQQVGEMMLRLNTIPTFEKVELHYTQQRSYNNFETVDFEVAARVRTSQRQEEKNETGSS
ncbi:MAG: PilN domain-containing protein [Armatimonadota bacterium]|nr:PilN domain-containing protein [bacterium]MDW8321042.1 PilN domain-containing protein [Armatimonadota bacterium]